MSFSCALRIANEAHKNQTRMNGDPYIFHSIRVMQKQTTLIARMAAILHDVVEDSHYELHDLFAEGIPAYVVSVVELLTFNDVLSEAEYLDAIERLAVDPNARAVKIADLEDNMDLLQIPRLVDKDLVRMVTYYKAYQYLKEYERRERAKKENEEG